LLSLRFQLLSSYGVKVAVGMRDTIFTGVRFLQIECDK